MNDKDQILESKIGKLIFSMKKKIKGIFKYFILLRRIKGYLKTCFINCRQMDNGHNKY